METGARKSPGFLSVAQAAAALSISLDDLAGSARPDDPAPKPSSSSRAIKETIARIRRIKSDAKSISKSTDLALHALGAGDPAE